MAGHKEVTQSTNSDDEECPLSPASIALILGNLFRKESDGEAIDFYVRKSRIYGHRFQCEMILKLKTLESQVEECGGCFSDEPKSGHSIELVFPKTVDLEEVDSDLFDINYIDECVKSCELLNLEGFRVGKSPYGGAVDINSIMKGLISWDSVRRPRPEGRKLPDFGQSLQLSPQTSTTGFCQSKKKVRVEYSIEEDTAILKYLLERNFADRVLGSAIWKEVQKKFPQHTDQSLANRFKKKILPNLSKYKALRESERNLFRGYVPSSLNYAKSSSPEQRKCHTLPVHADASTSNVDGESDRAPNVADGTSLARTDRRVGTDESVCSSPSNGQINGDLNDACSLSVELHQHRLDSSEDGEGEESDLVLQISPSLSSSSRAVVQDSPTPSKGAEDDSSGADAGSESESEPECVTPNKISRLVFTVAEDRKILSFISESERYTEVNGSKLWRDIEERVFKGKRSWQTVKERFLNFIMADLELKEYGLDQRVVNQFRKRPRKLSSTSEDVLSTSNEVCTNSDSDSDSRIVEPKEKRPRHIGKTKLVNRRLGPYSDEEDRAIINYIVKKERYKEVRGKILWVDIQNKVLIEYGRTWESAKNRFLKTIMKNLSDKKYRLRNDVVDKFIQGATAERNLGGARREKQTERKRKKAVVLTKEKEDVGSETNQRKSPRKHSSVKHPALPVRTPTPIKAAKRRLYRPPAGPELAVFAPNVHAKDADRKSAKKPLGVDVRKQLQRPGADSPSDMPSCSNSWTPSPTPSSTKQLVSATFGKKSSTASSLHLEATNTNADTIVQSKNGTLGKQLPSIRSPFAYPLRRCSVIIKRLDLAGQGWRLQQEKASHTPRDDARLAFSSATPSTAADPQPTKESPYFSKEGPELIAGAPSSLFAVRPSLAKPTFEPKESSSAVSDRRWPALSSPLKRSSLQSLRQAITPQLMFDGESFDGSQSGMPYRNGSEPAGPLSIRPLGSHLSQASVCPPRSAEAEVRNVLELCRSIKTEVSSSPERSSEGPPIHSYAQLICDGTVGSDAPAVLSEES